VINCDSLCELERSRAEELCRMFLPNGKKVGSEWKVGDVSGVPGLFTWCPTDRPKTFPGPKNESVRAQKASATSA